MLEEKHMPKFYRPEAVRITVYLQNQTFAKGGVSPHELYFGKKPNLGHLRVFDNIAYVHVPKEKRRKLYAKAKKCILVDYSENRRFISVITPEPNKLA